MAEKDLIPFNKRTVEEQKRITTMGGVASGKSRRAKRTLQERIKLALTISTNENLKALKRQIRELWPNRQTKANRESLKTLLAQTKTMRDCGIDVYRMLQIAEAPETQEIAMKATNALWDREDGKPTNKNEHAGLDGQPLQPFQINVQGVESKNKDD